MDTNKIFTDFCNALSRRTRNLTEDNIRYYWFANMLKQDSDLNHYCLEEQYNPNLCKNINLGHAELDLHYDASSNVIGSGVGSDNLCFEMKLHRFTGSTLTYTENVGKVINDLRRLGAITLPVSRKLFLYVTDDAMETHLLKATAGINSLPTYRSQVSALFSLAPGQAISLTFSASQVPVTFWREAAKSVPIPHPASSFSLNLKLLDSATIQCPAATCPTQDSSIPIPASSTPDIHIRLFEVK